MILPPLALISHFLDLLVLQLLEDLPEQADLLELP